MSTESHSYETQIEWIGRRLGNLQSAGLPDLEVSAPPEFKGNAGFWTPEHLFVAAAESCLMATFVGIAENSRLAVAGYRSSSTGRLEWTEGGWRFTELVISPVIELESSQDQPLAERVLARAEKGCLIARSMRLAMRVEPKFLVSEALAA